ncbi:Zeta toxin [Candidatus Burkholderia verschuerenii]|uniref:Zeta toxin n=1 Tax=Candidatus Burkholderia verschuerenii TaxID=242163 RepID=A0A0L0MDQ0_9BURK|nr:zeta toxin family protein [Candidatus Burkholderia verschuerenii]KND60405.1 Zeta toxin [Candidatus Burkholderia verschuerenii]
MKPEDFKLSQSEHDKQFAKIRSDAFAGLTPETRPRAIFTGGQPGSGKSMIAAQAMKDFGYNAVRVDADELRPYHKDYERLMVQGVKNAPDLVHNDAGRWAASLTQEAMQQRYNLVIDGTMRDPQAIATVASRLREAGYTVEGRVMAVNDLVSTFHIHKRYENQMQAQGVGRFSTKEQHDRAFSGLPTSLELLERNKSLDKLTLFNRDGAAIYRNELDRDRWIETPAARQALEIERNREMTLDEKRDLATGWGGVVKQMKERAAPADELASTTKLATDEVRKSASHGRGRGYEKLFASAEQMRKQPALVGKFATLVASQEGAKRAQLEGVQQAIAKMGDRLAARKQEAISDAAPKPKLPPPAKPGVVAPKRSKDADKDR